MTRPLSEQRVIITGAGQGLGAAIAKHFALAGAGLALMDYDADALAATALRCGPRAIAIHVDLSDRAQTSAAITKIFGQLGRIDTVIHNAAILKPTPFSAETFEGFFQTVNVGLQAGFQLVSAVWDGMSRHGGGAIVFVSSRSGIEGFKNEAAYCAGKHALEGLAKSLALEGEPLGITVNTVTPGMYINTPMSSRNYTEDLKQQWIDPALLAPAFLLLAEQKLKEQNGVRLDAWKLSQEMPLALRES